MQRKFPRLKWAGRHAIPATALVLFLLPSRGFAQEAHAAAGVPGSGTTVVSNVDEVSLDIEVYDKKGNVVPDLKPGDIEIVDGRAPVRLNDLRLVTEGPASRQRVILLFDQMEPGNAKTARDAAFEILKEAPADMSFMVLRIDGRLHLLEAPTADREALKAAITAATVADGATYASRAGAAESALQEDIKGGPREAASKAMMAMLLDSQNTAADPHMTPSVAGLLAACRGQRGVAGRKTLIYFSQSLDWNVSAPESLRQIIEAANQARVTIDSIDAHAIDPRATSTLLATSSLATASAAGHTGFGGSSGPTGNLGPAGMGDQVAEQTGRFENEDVSLNKAPLETISQRTGGVHEVSGNARRSTKKIVDDLSSYYVASYAIPADAEQGRFRPVSVRSARPGIVLLARSGYFVPPRASHPAAAFEPRLLAALAAPNLPQDLQFRSALIHFGDAGSGNMNEVVLAAPLGDVELRADAVARTSAAHLGFLAQVKDKSGKVVETFSEDVPKQVPLDAHGKAGQEVITVHRHFEAPPGDYVLEAVALDVNSGKIAAQRSPVTIPATPAGPSLSDIVLARRIDPYAGDEDVDRADPLRCADGRVVPNLSGHVTKATDPSLTLFFQIYPQRGSSAAPVLKAEVRRNGAVIGNVPLNLGESAGKASIPYVAQLGTSSLQPGAYTLTVLLQQGDQSAKQSVSFNLE